MPAATSPTSARDTHRGAIYAAEDALARMFDRGAPVEFFGSMLTLPVERRFADIASMQTYVDAVLLRLAPGLPSVTVRERAGTTKAHYEHPRPNRAAVIAVPLTLVDNRRWAARESVLLHEIAHHLSHHDSDAQSQPVHGPVFCRHLLTAHERIIGPESALLLRAALDSAGVPVAHDRRGA